MKIIELEIKDLDQDFIDAISLVDYPAIESDFKKFGKQSTSYTLSKVDDEKKEIVGPALLKKLIYRYDQSSGEEYYVFFSEKTIRLLAFDYMRQQRLSNSKTDHQQRVNDVYVVESWIVEDTENDKSKLLGFNVPIGTWMVRMKIDNEKVWERIKNGELKGFSVEAWMTERMINNSKMLNREDSIKEILMTDKTNKEKEEIIRKILFSNNII